jgi:hypothetical protein
MNTLELRMYGLVPYNISPIQQAIQYGHAVVEYGLENFHSNSYLDWAKYWKTFIILNGGTTNTSEVAPGSLNQHLETLKQNGIVVSSFKEPDLGDQLTAVVFLVDERVFNKKYLDFPEWLMENYNEIVFTYMVNFEYAGSLSKIAEAVQLEKNEIYEEWISYIGGTKNAFLRDFLKNFKLA